MEDVQSAPTWQILWPSPLLPGDWLRISGSYARRVPLRARWSCTTATIDAVWIVHCRRMCALAERALVCRFRSPSHAVKTL